MQKRQKLRVKFVKFRLHFRRDVFPLRWHPEKDRPAARLVFAQVCSSIKNGENVTKNVSYPNFGENSKKCWEIFLNVFNNITYFRAKIWRCQWRTNIYQVLYSLYKGSDATYHTDYKLFPKTIKMDQCLLHFL